MIRMLVSVRDCAEALRAAEAEADYIDLKDPQAGALGGLATGTIREILGALQMLYPALAVSATIGDLPAGDLRAIASRVEAVGQCGVDLVKVGVPGAGAPAARRLLAWLAGCGWPVVPVFLADDGIDPDFLAQACTQCFPAVMLDTQRKAGGSLFDRVPAAMLAEVLAHARANAKPLGLAGALGTADLPLLLGLQPDFAGFRSAVCDGPRTGRLSGDKVRALRAALSGTCLERTC